MKNHSAVRKKLPLASLAARFLLVGFLVFATFNPTYYSISTWIISGASLLSVRLFVAFALALIWLIVLRISLAGMGRLGMVYVGAALLTAGLLHLQFGLFGFVSFYTFLLFGELVLTAILTFGLAFSFWVRQLSGQSAVVKTPP